MRGLFRESKGGGPLGQSRVHTHPPVHVSSSGVQLGSARVSPARSLKAHVGTSKKNLKTGLAPTAWPLERPPWPWPRGRNGLAGGRPPARISRLTTAARHAAHHRALLDRAEELKHPRRSASFDLCHGVIHRSHAVLHAPSNATRLMHHCKRATSRAPLLPSGPTTASPNWPREAGAAGEEHHELTCCSK